MSTESDLQSLLGALVSGRCYPLVAPDPVIKPYITFQVINDDDLTALDGPIGTNNKRIQVNAWATTYGGAKTLKDSIKAAMAGSSIVNLPIPSLGDTYDPETKLHGQIMEFSIWA